MKTLIWILIWSCAGWGIAAQEEPGFRVQLSADTVLMGHPVEVTFVLENIPGQHFSPPDFEGFRLLSGPNVSSSFSMMGGQVSQNVSYTYVLTPTAPGEHWIRPAAIETDRGVLETAPLPVQVRDNPEGIPPASARKNTFDPFPDFFRDEGAPQPGDTLPPRTKRKIYRL